MHLALQTQRPSISRVGQVQLLLTTFRAEYEKDTTGVETEFARGELTAWRSSFHAMYHDYGKDIVNRVVTRICKEYF